MPSGTPLPGISPSGGGGRAKAVPALPPEPSHTHASLKRAESEVHRILKM